MRRSGFGKDEAQPVSSAVTFERHDFAGHLASLEKPLWLPLAFRLWLNAGRFWRGLDRPNSQRHNAAVAREVAVAELVQSGDLDFDASEESAKGEFVSQFL